MNDKLYDKKYPIPSVILDKIAKSLTIYSNSDGVKRAKNLLGSKYCTYQNMKRLKNFFEGSSMMSKEQYELAGGDLMRDWVNKSLDSDRKSIENITKNNNQVNNNKETQSLYVNESNNAKKNEVVIAILVDSGGKFLLVKRDKNDDWMPSKWAFVGGGIESGENKLDGIKREIFEEIGINIDKISDKYTLILDNVIEHFFFGVISDKDRNSLKLNDEHHEYDYFTIDEIRDIDGVPNLLDFIRIMFNSEN